jgi:outer membrane biogenesis lipoprotein LolB
VRSTLSIALLALLAACASAEWVNSGGQMADEPVLTQCSQQAWARAHYEQMGKGGIPAQVIQRDKSGRAAVTSDSISLTQSDVQEQTYFNLCMKEKGYDLVPIKPGASR